MFGVLEITGLQKAKSEGLFLQLSRNNFRLCVGCEGFGGRGVNYCDLMNGGIISFAPEIPH